MYAFLDIYSSIYTVVYVSMTVWQYHSIWIYSTNHLILKSCIKLPHSTQWQRTQKSTAKPTNSWQPSKQAKPLTYIEHLCIFSMKRGSAFICYPHYTTRWLLVSSWSRENAKKAYIILLGKVFTQHCPYSTSLIQTTVQKLHLLFNKTSLRTHKPQRNSVRYTAFTKLLQWSPQSSYTAGRTGDVCLLKGRRVTDNHRLNKEQMGMWWWVVYSTSHRRCDDTMNEDGFFWRTKK